MNEKKIVTFTIKNGVIVEARESRKTWQRWHTTGPLTSRGDIEDAVARVANTPVGGKENSSEEKP